MTEVVDIRLAGEDFKLPVTMAQARALDVLGLCPYKAAQEALQRRQVLTLSYPRACDILAVGMVAAGLKGMSTEDLWKAGRSRKEGVKETVEQALTYWLRFVTAMDDPLATPVPEDPSAPKQ